MKVTNAIQDEAGSSDWASAREDIQAVADDGSEIDDGEGVQTTEGEREEDDDEKEEGITLTPKSISPPEPNHLTVAFWLAFVASLAVNVLLMAHMR